MTSPVSASPVCPPNMQVVFEDPSGRLEMFDFGPLGGDVHVNAPGLQCSGSSNKRRKRSVQGEVRHTQVSADPQKTFSIVYHHQASSR